MLNKYHKILFSSFFKIKVPMIIANEQHIPFADHILQIQKDWHQKPALRWTPPGRKMKKGSTSGNKASNAEGISKHYYCFLGGCQKSCKFLKPLENSYNPMCFAQNETMTNYTLSMYSLMCTVSRSVLLCCAHWKASQLLTYMKVICRL